MPMKPRLIVASLMPPDVVARARAEFDAVVAKGEGDMTLDEVLVALAEYRTEALLFTTTLKLNAAAIGRLPDFLKIAATSSVGFDHIDVPAARERGLIVTNTPGVLTEATAELAF
ncbi:MAG: D-glycerate dehydrogenase, partial [Acetobacteraceae bacterium]|nr:D-glycerate dehydrogenase [Acetobacteraceae bacterium]